MMSDDLRHWEKQGMILGRGPEGSVTEFNVAMTSILRDNELYGPGTLKPIDGRRVAAPTIHSIMRRIVLRLRIAPGQGHRERVLAPDDHVCREDEPARGEGPPRILRGGPGGTKERSSSKRPARRSRARWNLSSNRAAWPRSRSWR